MTSSTEQMKQALLEIRRLRRELESRKQHAAKSGPIAIVGAGLRLPGGISDLAGFEALLTEGRHAISHIPSSRWQAADMPADLPPSAHYGAFLDHVDLFDAEFFGISGLEAASMDPQQRLVLETGWEALENAGYAPDSLTDTPLGVYLGMANSDYGRTMLTDLPAIDPYFTSGSSFSVASGRLAYFLGSKGPAITLDTACSSSLVALHLACQALKAGECDMALAGGVNLILSPEVHVNFSRASMLAGDGLCKTFDADADGYVRGEGCVIFTLRRLEDAQADGDHILGIIRGSAINQDGRSNGLTAPNGPSQETLIREALKEAGVTPDQVSYVEAHGTGTPLGDPIEMNALARAYGRDRKDAAPIYVGSVKTNLGHLESAAGAAGILKSLVALKSGRLPAHLNFKTPNPHIDWDTISVRVPTEGQAWPKMDGPRLSGVSSFGFSGTNAHIILEQPHVAEAAAPTEHLSWQMFPLSARSPTALVSLAGKMAATLEDSHHSLADTCFTAGAGRAHFPSRLAVAARSRDDLVSALKTVQEGKAHPDVTLGRAVAGKPPRIAFLFTGQGAQYAQMGRELYETQPVYRNAIDQCADLLGDTVPGGLVAALHAVADTSRLQDPSTAQPALFALEYALAKLWISFGVKAEALCGHSLGEFVAATLSGVMPLEDALRLVAERGKLTAEAGAAGMMASVFADEDTLRNIISASPSIEIAAYNGPANHVLSGPSSDLEPLVARLNADGIRADILRIAFAAHCKLVDPVVDRFRAAAQRVRFGKASIPIVSNLTGGYGAEISTAEHWSNHLRQPVRFSDGIRTLLDAGITHFIEIGPHPVLSGMAAEIAAGTHTSAPVFLPSLRRDGNLGQDLASSVGRLYVDGAGIDPACLARSACPKRISLPTYPFERTRHWHSSAPQPGGTRHVSADLSWSRLCTRLDRESVRGPLGFDASAYPQKWQTLADFRRLLIIYLLCEAGLFATDGETHRMDAIITSMKVCDALVPLAIRWMQSLADSGDLTISDEYATAPKALKVPDLDAGRAMVRQALSDNIPLSNYILHCADLLGPVVRGDISPLETLFPGGDFSLALGLYERSATMQYMNGLAAAAVDALASARPGLKILEAGAGTGGTSAAVLDTLRDTNSTYHYTDVSDLFLDRARTRFRNVPDMKFALFDLERPPEEQGLQTGSYDIVLASNAVHAVRNLPETLTYLRSLLRPSGTLVLVESTTHFAWFDVTTGLIEGWRHAEDNLRDDLALLNAPKWRAALLDAGFASAETWPRDGSTGGAIGQHLVVARTSSNEMSSSTGEIIAEPQFMDIPELEADPEIQSALEAIEAALPKERPQAICDLLRKRVMTLLRRRTDQPPGDHERLLDIGLDSLMAVQLRNALAQDLHIPAGLPTTLVFDYPTLSAMADYLSELTQPDSTESAATSTTSSTQHTDHTDIADMTDEEVEALLMERLKK
ncbi:MAG: acyltransferase domain-containing protein [Alphaproteobacteria bacterium]|nr:acyltransferase domain-containing protein [Alphaproteobacteria bacterium]|tara:strand:+ start:12675 stop:17030 length:4356 start_codon:yes stop_codon:yes gene_type:complete